jgi:hypothetical protein
MESRNYAKCEMKLKGIGGAVMGLFGCCVHVYFLHYIANINSVTLIIQE